METAAASSTQQVTSSSDNQDSKNVSVPALKTESANGIKYISAEELINKYEYFISDVDGVYFHGSEEIPGSFDFLRKAMGMGKKVILLTNQSQRSREEFQQTKLIGEFDFHMPIDSLYTSPYLTSLYLKQHVLPKVKDQVENPSVYVIGQPGFKNELHQSGIRVLNMDDNEGDQISMNDTEFANVKVDPSVVAVCVGIQHSFNYRQLCMSNLYIQQNNAVLIGSNRDRNDGRNGRFMPSAGSVIKCVETAAQQTALMMGKPDTTAFDTIRNDHGWMNEDLSKFIMIGDNLETDIKFGNNCGIDSVLVLSGVTNELKAEAVVLQNSKHESEGTPNYVMQRLSY